MILGSGIKLCKKIYLIMNKHLRDNKFNQEDNMVNKMTIKIDN